MVLPTYNNIPPRATDQIIEGWTPSVHANLTGEELIDFLILHEELAAQRRLMRQDMRREMRREHMEMMRHRRRHRRL